MISGGKLGAARPRARAPKQPPATTPIGSWPVRFKFTTFTATADGAGGGEIVHYEMPYSQRFYDRYHLHAAYWHDAFGEPRSGGCVNLSPIDARWLFEWSEPQVPQGWYAYATRDEAGEAATLIVIHP
jgi:lipoprotein-anchoring transpeptidase ErfK/SrfK